MSILNIFSLVGGIALLLFGMTFMGDSLEKAAGNKLTSILESLTSNRLKGVLLGLGVTAIIQSSAATTVMVVGFVNSGIMRLSQAIGVIMGANIGTTATAWLLSLASIGGEGSGIIQLLKPSSFSPILAFIGTILYMFTKKQRAKDIGGIFLGFAILMTGMETMSAAVEPLSDMPQFTNILLLFSNPILGVLSGAILTAIVQSSSASVGILQALAVTGSVTYANAIPIILGQNIGTCVTAMISSIGANKNAKRAAVFHLCFNIIGTTLFLLLFYLLNAIVKFSFINESISAVNVAVIHSIFNIFATVVLFPFGNALEKLACIIVPDHGSDKKTQLLDERLLNTPTIAVAQAKKLTDHMAELACQSLKKAMSLLEKFDSKVADEIADSEKEIDMYEDKLGTFLVKLSRESLSISDSHEISNLLHTIGDFERMGDHAVNIYEVAAEINSKKLTFSPNAMSEIQTISAAVTEILDMTAQAFIEENIELAKKVEPLEQLIDRLKKKMKSHHIKRLQSGECTIETGFVFSDLVTNYERVADHCSNVAVCLIQVSNDSFDTHEYLNHVKADGENDFEENYEMYKNKYRI